MTRKQTGREGRRTGWGEIHLNMWLIHEWLLYCFQASRWDIERTIALWSWKGRQRPLPITYSRDEIIQTQDTVIFSKDRKKSMTDLVEILSKRRPSGNGHCNSNEQKRCQTDLHLIIILIAILYWTLLYENHFNNSKLLMSLVSKYSASMISFILTTTCGVGSIVVILQREREAEKD